MMDIERRDRLLDERNELMNSYGLGPVADGQIGDRIAEIDVILNESNSCRNEGRR